MILKQNGLINAKSKIKIISKKIPDESFKLIIHYFTDHLFLKFIINKLRIYFPLKIIPVWEH